MDRIQQIVPISELKLNQPQVVAMLTNGPVVLAHRSKPAAVLVSVEEWDRVADELAERRFTQREVEAIVKAKLAESRNEPTISHEELKARMAERYGDPTNPV